jgi:hypothetical protein
MAIGLIIGCAICALFRDARTPLTNAGERTTKAGKRVFRNAATGNGALTLAVAASLCIWACMTQLTKQERRASALRFCMAIMPITALDENGVRWSEKIA